jgi:2-polyprenyl-6-methoxyphenol hydroxylase-like FAD-dependent oxidoreductase
MRVAVIGAGPAGLLFATLLKQASPATEVVVFEQNAAGSTFGFGVVFSDRALDFLRDDDPTTHALIEPALEIWRDITLVHQGARVVIDGVGFAAIGRLTLLELLHARAHAVGVDVRHGQAVANLTQCADFDLVVGADGINSLVRRSFPEAFGVSEGQFANHFIWYGTDAPFDTLTQTFVTASTGHFNAHHYRYAPGHSTFIVECDSQTWQRSGFATMDATTTAATCADVFRETLGGHGLTSNKSVWRNFPKLWCAEWHHAGRYVLLGDALHTAHFSIGSGTRLAFEDAIALARAVGTAAGDIPNALAAYQAQRQPIVKKIVTAANTSASWYDVFPEHMALAPYALAMSYITRSGRLDIERLRRASPQFVAAAEEAGVF